MRRLALSIATLLLVSACGTVQVGREFDLLAFAAKVQRGTTTQAEVRAWLGAPAGTGDSVDTAGERYEEWSYYRGTGSLPDMTDAKLKTLQVKFDQRGVVRGYNWSGGRD